MPAVIAMWLPNVVLLVLGVLAARRAGRERPVESFVTAPPAGPARPLPPTRPGVPGSPGSFGFRRSSTGTFSRDFCRPFFSCSRPSCCSHSSSTTRSRSTKSSRITHPRRSFSLLPCLSVLDPRGDFAFRDPDCDARLSRNSLEEQRGHGVQGERQSPYGDWASRSFRRRRRSDPRLFPRRVRPSTREAEGDPVSQRDPRASGELEAPHARRTELVLRARRPDLAPGGRAAGVLVSPSIFEFDRTFELVRRTSAREATWDARSKSGFSGRAGRGRKGETISFATFLEERIAGDPPAAFAAERRTPEEMRFRELQKYARRLKRTGYPTASLETALQAKLAKPLLLPVMALLALPFAFRIGRRGGARRHRGRARSRDDLPDIDRVLHKARRRGGAAALFRRVVAARPVRDGGELPPRAPSDLKVRPSRGSTAGRPPAFRGRRWALSGLARLSREIRNVCSRACRPDRTAWLTPSVKAIHVAPGGKENSSRDAFF